MKILLVGGTFSQMPNPDDSYGKPSVIVEIIANTLDSYIQKNDKLTVYNGGEYDLLNSILHQAENYDIIFWFANVPDNNLPKIRNVKEIAPKAMLVTSKRNDNGKYVFGELVQRALASKSNLIFEFSKTDDNPIFNICIFDPLGCVWFEGNDVVKATETAMNRLMFLKNITRQATTQINTDGGLFLKWYFDQFAQPMLSADKPVDVPDEQKFVDIVRHHAETFHRLMSPGNNVKRFLGNCSMKSQQTLPQVGRCSKGMPSFRHGDYVFVSRRNVNKEFLDLSHFVPCYLDNNDNVCYCGKDKPSVDTPIQLRLYKQLPNIKYMIHSHCYISTAVSTKHNFPCGAIEEVDEILKTINEYYGTRNAEFYEINLIGHGSIVMSNNLESLQDIEYYKRPMPEHIPE